MIATITIRPKNSLMAPNASSGNKIAAQIAAIEVYIGFGSGEPCPLLCMEREGAMRTRSDLWSRMRRSPLVRGEVEDADAVSELR